jgi:hypothetical protein
MKYPKSIPGNRVFKFQATVFYWLCRLSKLCSVILIFTSLNLVAIRLSTDNVLALPPVGGGADESIWHFYGGLGRAVSVDGWR